MNHIYFLLLLILVGCNKNTDPVDLCADTTKATFVPCSSVTSVTAATCIIQEVNIHDGNGNLWDKFAYHHDGTNYDKIDRYYNEDTSKPFPTTPTETITFTYYPNGLIYQVKLTSFLVPGNPSTMVLTHTYASSTLNIRYDVLKTDGSVELTWNNDELYVSSPKDSLYYFYGPVIANNDHRALFDFKGSNLIRKGRTSTDGACVAHDARWLFIKNYYDNFPNVLKNYAVRYPLSIGKVVYGTMAESYVEMSANNIIGQIDHNGQTEERAEYCWTFLKNGAQTYWVKKFQGLAPRQYTVTYTYDCE